MDWVFTPSSSWDLTEVDIDDLDVLSEKNQDIDAFSGSSIPMDEVNGINGIVNRLSDQKHSMTSSSPSGSSKKPTVESIEQQVSCVVDGCMADLSGCRDYHRRHRVCETHSKTPVVTIGGKEQRFCQQCSRFHSLGEFDEVKRSCRKRLDGHNRRRRKPRPESMYVNYRSFFTNHQGTKLLHFGGSPATTIGKWGENHKSNQKFQVNAEQRIPSDAYRKRRFPFLLGVDSEKVNQSFSESSFQQVVNTDASSGHLLVEPKGVLYLLSNSKHMIHDCSVSGPTNNLVQFSDSVSQPSGPLFPSRDVTGLNNGHHANNQLIGMIHFRSEGLLENEAAQVLSFSWD